MRVRMKTFPLAAFAAVFLLFACGDFRQDELDCEEAVAQLKDCCPGFDTAHVQCIYEQGDCNGGGRDPDIDEGTSACIRGESCDELRSSGMCTRAQQSNFFPCP
jgi:hypothetical protein